MAPDDDIFNPMNDEEYDRMCHRPIDKAMELMTDEWISKGEYCDQTIIDMRDIIKKLIEEKC